MADDDSIQSQKQSLMRGVLVALPLMVGLWFLVAHGMPPVAGCEAMAGRLAVALRCCALAALLCLMAGVEAVAHERLVSPAINPLAGRESRRMKVNLRYLQNTLEQWVLFAAGVLGLATYCDDGAAMRRVVATTVVWIVSRWVFWIAYHRGPQHRSAGLIGMMQSLLVLLYVSGRLGHDLAGVPGAIAVVGTFLGIEVFLVRVSSQPSSEA